MSIDMVRSVLLWCAVLNYGLLIVWALLFLLLRDGMQRFYSRWVRVPVEQFDAINYAGMMLYKIGIILFNLAPYIALRIVGSRL